VATTLDPATELAIRLDPSLLMELAGFDPDPWQCRALRTESKRLLLLASRQSGKSTCTALIALHEALFRPGSLVLLIARAERQSLELLRKVVGAYDSLGRPVAAVRELQSSLELANGSRIIALPGENAATIRCYSGVTTAIIDEAAQALDAIFIAIMPMLGVSNGRLLCLSTPFGKRGWFFEQWVGTDPAWERIVSRAVDCPRISAEFLEEERRMLGPAMYSQEQECQFLESEGQVFSAESIAAVFQGAEDGPVLLGF
jgi:hypothetical protein